MKILLVSSLLALAAANVIPAEQSGNQEVQHPGMCFEDYFRKHSDELEKFQKKMLEEELDPEPSRPESNKHWPQNQQDGAHPQRKPNPWYMIDFSKLKNCSVEQDCDLSEKCCRTLCGMRCTSPMFEKNKMRHQEHHSPDETEKQEPDEEVQQREKRSTNDEDSGSGEKKGQQREMQSISDEDSGSEEKKGQQSEKQSTSDEDSDSEEKKGQQREKRSTSDEDSGSEAKPTGQSGREKKSDKKDGKCKGKKGKEHGSGTSKRKGKGEGERKHGSGKERGHGHKKEGKEGGDGAQE